jgi:hypothetical protein
LLAGLARSEQAEERGMLVASAARLTALDGVPAEVVAEVDAATTGLGLWAVEALGHLAAGPLCNEERRSAIVKDLVDQVCEELPDQEPETRKDPATDDVTYVLDDRLAAHTENVPRLLAAIDRIGHSPHLPGPLLATLVSRLCTQWRRVASWHTIWGPANIQELGRLLGRLAEQRAFPGPLRIRIAESLMPKLPQLAIARSLARLFTVSEGAYLSDLAGKAAQQLVQLAADGYYADDEQAELIEVLVDLLAIPHLGRSGDGVRRRIAALVGTRRADCTSRAHAKLRAILPDLPEDMRVKLDWA